MSIGSKLLILRALCNGKTLAFQAKDAGSIPAARSKSSLLVALPRLRLWGLRVFSFSRACLAVGQPSLAFPKFSRRNAHLSALTADHISERER
jgi:hypothetical protein